MKIVRDFFILISGEMMNLEDELRVVAETVRVLKNVYCQSMLNSLFHTKKLTQDQELIHKLSDVYLINSIPVQFSYMFKNSGVVEILYEYSILLAVNSNVYESEIRNNNIRKTKHSKTYRDVKEQAIFELTKEYTEENIFQDSLVLDDDEIKKKLTLIELNRHFDDNRVWLNYTLLLRIMRDIENAQLRTV